MRLRSILAPTVLRASALMAGLLTAANVTAYTVFDGTPKWGSLTPGTGAVITWSLIPDGTDVLRRPPNFPPDEPFLFHDFWLGTSDLSSIFAQLDASPVVGESLFMTALTNAFDVWSALTNVSFVQVSDSGLPLGYPAGVPTEYPTPTGVGDIRIGAWSLAAPFDAIAAHSFEPPGGTSPGALYLAANSPSTFGDITLNKDAFFSVWPGLGEGDFYGGFPNDIENLLIHELGHSLGLGHPESDGLDPGEADAIMYVGPGCCDTIQRTLAPDDIAGIQYLYGTTAVPEPGSLALFGIAIPGIAHLLRIRRRRDGLTAAKEG